MEVPGPARSGPVQKYKVLGLSPETFLAGPFKLYLKFNMLMQCEILEAAELLKFTSSQNLESGQQVKHLT